MEINPSDLVTKDELDARIQPMQQQLRRIENKLDGGTERGLSVLSLSATILIPCVIALAAWVTALDEIGNAKSEARFAVASRDLYWLEKHEDGMWDAFSAMRDDLSVRAQWMAETRAFVTAQERSNERQQDQLDKLDESASVDKDELERDALEEIRSRLERVEEGVRRNFFRRENP